MLRLSDRELALVQRVAMREPLATFCRRIALDYCERSDERRKGGK